MKDGIHPNYREVVFVDLSNDFKFITRSTVQTKETVKWTDGKEYPLYSARAFVRKPCGIDSASAARACMELSLIHI